jgi:hypothetical protein
MKNDIVCLKVHSLKDLTSINFCPPKNGPLKYLKQKLTTEE